MSLLRILRPARRFADKLLDRKGLRKAKEKLREIARLKQEIAPGMEIRLDADGRVFLHEPSERLDYYFPVETEELVKIGNFAGFEERERALVKAALKDGTAMIDVGANVGVFSLSAARAREKVGIYAFEPVRDNFAVLKINLARNGLEKRIEARQLALGDKRDVVELPTGVGTWQFVASAADKKHSEGMSTQKVEQHTLDELVKEHVREPVSLIKCDVEGYELFVLRGALGTLKSQKPALLLEIAEKYCARFQYKPREIFQLLEPLGYSYVQLSGGGNIRAGKLSDQDVDFSGSNFFFVPAERAAEFRAFLPG